MTIIYRIETARLVIRAWQPADAPLLKAAIDASLDHLRPWMPWVKHEPEPVANKIALIRRWRSQFDGDSDYVYGIFAPDERAVWGGTGLHRRGSEDALEIGYWIHAEQLGRGLATEVSAALTQAAFQNPAIKRVEIHCDPRNVRSAAIPRKLGYTHDGTLRERSRDGNDQPCDSMIWSLMAREFADSPAAAYSIKLFDILGQPVGAS